MQEPKIHSKITRWLPDDHWLLEFMEPHKEDGHLRLNCIECGFEVYNPDDGTILTWVETGWSWPDHPDEEHPDGHRHVGVFCIFCLANLDGEIGLTPTDGWINPALALEDDGSPQPMSKLGTTNTPPVLRRGGQEPIPLDER